MQERGSDNRRKLFMDRLQVALGTLVGGATVLTAVDPEDVRKFSGQFSMDNLLRVTTDAGIPIPVTLAALGIISAYLTVDGIKEIRKNRRNS